MIETLSDNDLVSIIVDSTHKYEHIKVSDLKKIFGSRSYPSNWNPVYSGTRSFAGIVIWGLNNNNNVVTGSSITKAFIKPMYVSVTVGFLADTTQTSDYLSIGLYTKNNNAFTQAIRLAFMSPSTAHNGNMCISYTGVIPSGYYLGSDSHNESGSGSSGIHPGSTVIWSLD